MSETETGGAPMGDRKPRLFLLGEFSAGKSTLANCLLGQASSPVRVTATQVPPIWYTHGTGDPTHIAIDGAETPLARDALDTVPIDRTRAVRIPLQADILEQVDIFDLPGGSDPNMPDNTWDALLPLADIAIWCTPATQAWRQSEAAIWDDVPPQLHARSLLLLTRIDKVAAPDDRARLVRRIEKETRRKFHCVLPVSLLEAAAAGSDPEALRASGLTDVIATLTQNLTDPGKPPMRRAAEHHAAPSGDAAAPAADRPADIVPAGAAPDAPPSEHRPTPTVKPRIVPRRVSSATLGGHRRHRSAGDGDGSLL